VAGAGHIERVFGGAPEILIDSRLAVSSAMEKVDRSAIFLNLCNRSQIRKGAKLPFDMKAEYVAAIKLAEAARLRAIRAPIESQVRAEFLDQMRAQYGPTWPSDSGGRWMLMGLVRQVLAERYGF
jgi:hypothetical protein